MIIYISTFFNRSTVRLSWVLVKINLINFIFRISMMHLMRIWFHLLFPWWFFRTQSNLNIILLNIFIIVLLIMLLRSCFLDIHCINFWYGRWTYGISFLLTITRIYYESIHLIFYWILILLVLRRLYFNLKYVHLLWVIKIVVFRLLIFLIIINIIIFY